MNAALNSIIYLGRSSGMRPYYCKLLNCQSTKIHLQHPGPQYQTLDVKHHQHYDSLIANGNDGKATTFSDIQLTKMIEAVLIWTLPLCQVNEVPNSVIYLALNICLLHQYYLLFNVGVRKKN